MKRISIFALLLTGIVRSWPIYAVGILDLEANISPKLRKYIFFDQHFNTPGAATLDQLTKEEMDFRVREFRAKFAGDELKPIGVLDKNAGYFSAKLLSNKTFIFIHPSGDSKIIKLLIMPPDRGPVNQARAQKILGSQLSGATFRFVEENSLGLFVDSTRYEFATGDTTFITESPYQVYPLHGIFTIAVREFATAAKMTISEWLLNEYVPKLAKMFAELHYRHGFNGGTHTQNLLVEIDESTGRIQNFLIRDLRDLAHDRELQHYWYPEKTDLNEDPNTWNIFDPDLLGITNGQYKRHDAAKVISEYVVKECVRWVVQSSALRDELEKKFLQVYSEEVAKIHTLKLNRSRLLIATQEQAKLKNATEEPGLLFLRELDYQVRQKIRRPLSTDDLLASSDGNAELLPMRTASLGTAEYDRRGNALRAFDGNNLWDIVQTSDGRYDRVAYFPLPPSSEMAAKYRQKRLELAGGECREALAAFGLRPGQQFKEYPSSMPHIEILEP